VPGAAPTSSADVEGPWPPASKYQRVDPLPLPRIVWTSRFSNPSFACVPTGESAIEPSSEPKYPIAVTRLACTGNWSFSVVPIRAITCGAGGPAGRSRTAEAGGGTATAGWSPPPKAVTRSVPSPTTAIAVTTASRRRCASCCLPRCRRAVGRARPDFAGGDISRTVSDRHGGFNRGSSQIDSGSSARAPSNQSGSAAIQAAEPVVRSVA
jgi:hypothetical protein